MFVDAPCTGIGALRRNPEARWRLREAELAGFAERQLEIVAAAKRLIAPGGLLVYATCSVLAAENGDVAASITAAHDDLAAVSLRARFGAERAEALGDGESLIVTPDRHGTDGFYAQVFRRT